MDGHQERMSADQMTPKQILAEGWRLTRAPSSTTQIRFPEADGRSRN
jgi:hypothetical protein